MSNQTQQARTMTDGTSLTMPKQMDLPINELDQMLAAYGMAFTFNYLAKACEIDRAFVTRLYVKEFIGRHACALSAYIGPP